MLVIAGLGNPGIEYRFTRHNMGFLVVEKLCEIYSLNLNHNKKFNSLFSKLKLSGKDIIIMKPLTYMNNSGIAIKSVFNFFKIELDNNLLVISDDVNLTFEKIRLRTNGSSGGHNGLDSVISNFNSLDFYRLRLGIGDKPPRISLSDYVLSDFTADEMKKLEGIISLSAETVKCLIEKGIEFAMNKYN